MCSAFSWPRGLKNDVCFMCSALVSPHGLKNDEYYMCKVLVSGHWHVTCVARFIFWFKRPISHVWRAWLASRTTYYWYYMCDALDSPHGLKNDVNYMCSACFWPHGLKNDVHFMCGELVSPQGLKNDVCFMCSALVSPHGLKNDEYYMCKVLVSGHWHVTCVARFIFWFKRPISHVWSTWFASRTTYYWYYMCSALVSPHGFKNDVYYMYSALVSLMALKTTYMTCSALVSPHFYVCCELTFRWVWSTLARTSCLHRIRSSLFANVVNPPRSC